MSLSEDGNHHNSPPVMEMEEPNLAYSDDDRIDFEQLRRDLTPAQRIRLEEIQREMNERMIGAAKVEPGSPNEHHKP